MDTLYLFHRTMRIEDARLYARTFSAQTDTACEELYLDLIKEIERLKA